MFRHCFAFALLASVSLAQTVPSRVTFTGRIADSGLPVQGNRDFVFKLFPTVAGGSEVWLETRSSVPVTDGVVNVELGAITPLTPAILDGQALYLEVTVGSTVLSPRTPLLSVPYAVRSSVAAQVGSLTAAQIQQRVSSACGAGAAIQAINADGTVVCQGVGADDAGVSTITNITAGAGLTGGGASGNVNLAANFGGNGTATTLSRSDHLHEGTYLPLGPVLACTGNDRVVSINGATGSVVCAANPASSFTGTAPISVTGNAIGLITCAANEVLKMNGGSWRCMADDNSGGTVTGVTASAPLISTGGAAPVISLGVVPVSLGGAGASLASTGGVHQFVKQSATGGPLSVGLITSAELPAHVHAGSDLTSGVVPVSVGGTGASLASSGGTGQVVKQITLGGPLSVGPIAAADLPSTVQNWATQPSCPVGQYLTGISSSGSAICAAVPVFGGVTSVAGCCNPPPGFSCTIPTGNTCAVGPPGTFVTVASLGAGRFDVTFPWMSTGVFQVTSVEPPGYAGRAQICVNVGQSANPFVARVLCYVPNLGGYSATFSISAIGF